MDSEKKAEDIIRMLQMQEEILQFQHFSNEDAIELGRFMVSEARIKGISVSVSIRRCSGAVVFQALMDGTTLDNCRWMDRKFQTVRHTEMSSLAWFMQLQEEGATMADKFLDENVYACAGGGFPVRVEDAGVIGVILVSGLNHVQDHDFIIRCLSKYLHMDEVPRIRQADFGK